MKKVILLNKDVSMTPLQAIELFREKNPQYKDVKLGYAGRLDPMAEGLLLVLVGEENKKRKEYERMEKKYECEALFGLTTDTYDILGLLTQAYQIPPADLIKRLPLCLSSYIGKIPQAYPPYSSPRVGGKPLFWWAREGRLSEIVIPSKEVVIHDFQLRKQYVLPKQELHESIGRRIKRVHGSFRQEAIQALWSDFFVTTKETSFSIAQFSVTCSSGLYIRSLIHALGQNVGCGALSYSITRTQIGKYLLSEATLLTS